MNNTLECIAQALFKSWFVDFDPVIAKSESRKPEGLDDATAAMFPSSFTESALGLIPEGWEASSIGSSFKLTMGQSPPGETYNEDGKGVPLFQGRTDFGFRFPIERIYCTAPTRFAERNDTLVSVRAPVGDVNLAWEKCCIGRGIASLRHNTGAISFTYYTAKQLQTQFRSFNAEGTIFGSINKTDFNKISCVEPKKNVIMLFETIIGAIDCKIRNNEEQIQTLSQIRDALLPRLISGKLRVDRNQRNSGSIVIMTHITEDSLEQATLGWFLELDYQVVFGPDIAPPPDGVAPERDNYHQTILLERLKTRLQVINPDIPVNAIDDAIRQILAPNLPTVIQSTGSFIAGFGMESPYNISAAMRPLAIWSNSWTSLIQQRMTGS